MEGNLLKNARDGDSSFFFLHLPASKYELNALNVGKIALTLHKIAVTTLGVDIRRKFLLK